MKTPEYLFYKNKNYHLYYIPAKNIIIIEASGVIALECAQQAWMKALEKSEEHHIRKWMSDEADIELMNPKANSWWVKEWYPLAGQRLRYKGKRLTATVLSQRFYAEMSTKQSVVETLRNDAIVGQSNEYLEHLYFKSFDEAYNWIAHHDEEVV